MYGNFCGPYWSNGRFQESVIPTLEAIDDLDETCRVHDEVYARRGDLKQADRNFFVSNFGQSPLRTLFAIPVGFQYLLRANDILSTTYNIDSLNMTKNQNKQNLRGSEPAKQKLKNKKQKEDHPGMMTQMSTPPVSYGTTIRATLPKVTRTTTSARIVGRDFIGTVTGNGVSTFGMAKSALLSPAYFQSTVLGNLARSFETYCWNSLRIHYVPKVPTTVTGQIILASQHSISEPGLQPEAGTFLPRAMSQGNAAFGPLWTPNYIDIDCDGKFLNVDPATTSDPDDCIHEELQVYTQVSVAQEVGYLFAEYDVSFREPVYAQHSTLLPIATGPGQRVTLIDTSVNAANDDINLTDTIGTANKYQNGTVFRAVFDLQGSVAPVGATFDNMWRSGLFQHSTTTAFSSATSGVPFVGGLTLYLVVGGSSFTVYASLEQAINGIGSGQLFAGVLTTVIGSYAADIALVRYGNAAMVTVQ